MTSPLVALSFPAPGRLGFNADQAASVQNHEWSLVNRNALVNESDRLESRKGWSMQTTTGAHLAPTETAHLYIKDSTTSAIISSAVVSGSNKIITGVDSLFDITGALTPAANNWQFVNFNGKCVGFQQGETAIVYTGTGSFATIVPASGSVPSGNCGVSSHGRLWAVDSDYTTIKVCALLDETHWLTGAVTINTLEAWPDGFDLIVGITVFQDRLIVFGIRNILIYTGLDNPGSDLTLVDQISDGLSSRDAFVSTGEDLIFLSRTGLRSLNRALEYSELPLTSLAPQARNLLIQQIDSAMVAGQPIKMVYHRPLGGIVSRVGSNYWFIDIKKPEFARLFKWDGNNYAWSSAVSAGPNLYYGVTGGIGLYENYDDDGTPYHMTWKSPWLAVDQSNRYFIPKRAILYMVSGLPYVVTLTWAWDYQGQTGIDQRVINPSDPSEYEEDDTPASSENNEYATAEYGAKVGVVRQPFHMTGYGSYLQIGFDVYIDGSVLSIQQMDLFGKIGRVDR